MQQPIPEGSRPPDYLVLSIFSIICCFWPVGVIALLKSVEVSFVLNIILCTSHPMQTRRYCSEGQLSQAQASSREAKTFNMISIGIGVAINVFVWFFVLLSIIASIAVPAAAAARN